MKTTIQSLEDLSSFTQDFLSGLDGFSSHATIITLEGDLGAGKTAFVKACAKHLEMSEDITSPTFVIQKEYQLEDQTPFSTMIHIDAYRLEKASDLEYLGWDDLVKNSQNIIFIEWPSLVEGIALPDAINVSLEIEGRDARRITITK